MKKVDVKQVKNVQVEIDLILKSDVSKSKKMIQMFDLGVEIKKIAELMDVRYNFVYNVVSNYVNVNKITVESNKKDSVKDRIIELYQLGKTMKEISIELTTNYNYVFNTLKVYKKENPTTETNVQ